MGKAQRTGACRGASSVRAEGSGVTGLLLGKGTEGEERIDHTHLLIFNTILIKKKIYIKYILIFIKPL